MPRINYFNLGPAKQLNEIVVAGSHDAGITGGASNVQTQDRNIRDQARAGVRVFDIRIKAVGSKSQPLLKTYHGSVKNPDDRSARGAWGEGLTKILSDARSFVTSAHYLNEFVILKFDKCSNWPEIAQQCVNLLGGAIYTGIGNINLHTLQQLRGKVVVVFTPEGYAEVVNRFPPGSGILCIRSIDSAPYDAVNFDGIQYCGKGGTNWKSGGSDQEKIQENIESQTERMRKGLGTNSDPNVIGMMYWTTTGFLASIRDRNNTMWNGPHGALPPALKTLFKQGLKESIQSRIASSIDPTNYAGAQILKVFMPNIVMIDFADADKCNKIYDLNRITANQLTKAFQAADQEVQAFQAQMRQMKTRGGRVML